MAMRLDWNGAEYQRKFREAMLRRVKAACIFLSAQVKADISQPGTLRYAVSKRGRALTSKTYQKTVYNFTHSRPGNPPYKQKGTLRQSIGWEAYPLTLIGRVGTPLLYGLYLEKGTRKMAARPYLVRNLMQHRTSLTRILTATIKPGELPPRTSNQFRPGHFGRGARLAGFA